MRFRNPAAVVAALVAIGACGACGAKPDAKASSKGADSGANGEVQPPAKPHQPADSTIRSAPTASNSDRGTVTAAEISADTAHPRLNSGRTAHDSSSYASAIRAGGRMMPKWPAGPTALPGSIFPASRIIAYYGNPHSKKMGVLGEYPEQDMLSKLDNTVAMWKAADPSTPVIPAIHLVTVVAQGAPGPGGTYNRRESSQTIERAYQWAQTRKGLLFIDIQAGHSTLQTELPLLLKYLERPDVHLGVDPEFYMHYKREGLRPSTKVGQMMAADVNYAIQTLDKLVAEKKLPPKILIVHRFRADMVPDAESIRPTPRVQVVMDMDGWGPPWLKFDSYRDYITTHPVQFTGFKLFYHNDVKKGDALLTPIEVLRLLPRPLYIQYQ
jgi:hypothetical protein